MLITTEELKALYAEYEKFNDKLLERKLEAIEQSIRQYTNNNFQNRKIRCVCASSGDKLMVLQGTNYFKIGDTVQISAEELNNGLYVVKEVGKDYITIDKRLFDSNDNLVTKVEYPVDLIEGAINILKWDMFERDKVGIASETISRHSVSYQQYDGANTINGYPSMLFGFCNMYRKART